MALNFIGLCETVSGKLAKVSIRSQGESKAMTQVYNPKEDVKYAIRIATVYIGFFERFGIPVVGSKVLELGPGKNFGLSLILRCLGAQVTVADKYLSEWDSESHTAFYQALIQELPKAYPQASLDPIHKLILADRYVDSVVQRVSFEGDNLPMLKSNSFNMILSNAVMEHVEYPELLFKELYRVTAPGGFGVHQIDYRDHRDFSRPLEYLLLKEDEFQKIFREKHGECGNRKRARDFMQLFSDSSFIVDAVEHNMFTDTEYYKTIQERLQKHQHKYTEEDVRVLSGRIFVHKPAQPEIQKSGFFLTGAAPVAPKYLRGRPGIRSIFRGFQ